MACTLASHLLLSPARERCREAGVRPVSLLPSVPFSSAATPGALPPFPSEDESHPNQLPLRASSPDPVSILVEG